MAIDQKSLNERLWKEVRCGNAKAVTYLLELGADANVSDMAFGAGENNVLSTAVVKYAEAAVLHKEKPRGFLKVSQPDGIETDMRADLAIESFKNCIDALCSKGADPHAVGNELKTALDVSVQQGALDITDYFLNQVIPQQEAARPSQHSTEEGLEIVYDAPEKPVVGNATARIRNEGEKGSIER